jgi:queuine tRNA-ribosyltransferase
LFGIVQGGVDAGLRRESVEELVEIGFEGYGIGGLSVGEPKSATYEMVEHTAGLLPEDRPRYLMGVGTPEDLVECVARGIDMFDCVMPTREARHGSIFTSEGRIGIRNTRFAHDQGPLDPACGCVVCQRFSRGYLRHLFMAREALGPILATRHNIHFYLDTLREIRHAIRSGEYNELWSRVRLKLQSANVGNPEVNREN